MNRPTITAVIYNQSRRTRYRAHSPPSEVLRGLLETVSRNTFLRRWGCILFPNSTLITEAIPTTQRFEKEAADDTTRYLLNQQIIIPITLSTEEEYFLVDEERLEQLIKGEDLPRIDSEKALLERAQKIFEECQIESEDGSSEEVRSHDIDHDKLILLIQAELMTADTEMIPNVIDRLAKEAHSFSKWSKGSIILLLKNHAGEHLQFIEHEGLLIFSLDGCAEELAEEYRRARKLDESHPRTLTSLILQRGITRSFAKKEARIYDELCQKLEQRLSNATTEEQKRRLIERFEHELHDYSMKLYRACERALHCAQTEGMSDESTQP